MAKSYTPIFAVGKHSEIQPLITSGTLSYPSYIICTDDDEYNNTISFVDKDENIRDLRGYQQESILYVDELPAEGFRTDAFYICDDICYLYVDSKPVPVFSEDKFSSSYNDLNDTPIENKYGSTFDSIILSELPDGYYSVSGQYQIADGDTVYLTTSNVLFAVHTDGENKYITKIGDDISTLFLVNLETNQVTEERYATESYVQDVLNNIVEEMREYGFLTSDDIGSIEQEDITAIFD